MNFRMKAVSLSIIASAALMACGGGGGDAVTPAAAPPADVAAAAATTLTALGSPAAVTATNGTSTAYDVVAATGQLHLPPSLKAQQ